MLKDTEQTSRKYKIAALNQRLHKNSICPANHNINYYNGWYYLDGDPSQRPDITRRAKELEESFQSKVMYQSTWNTYVLVELTENGTPTHGSIHV